MSLQRAYLWQCPKTHNTAVIIAHSEGHARRWFGINYSRSEWLYMGVDSRSEVLSTWVIATLDADGKVSQPHLQVD